MNLLKELSCNLSEVSLSLTYLDTHNEQSQDIVQSKANPHKNSRSKSISIFSMGSTYDKNPSIYNRTSSYANNKTTSSANLTINKHISLIKIESRLSNKVRKRLLQFWVLFQKKTSQPIARRAIIEDIRFLDAINLLSLFQESYEVRWINQKGLAQAYTKIKNHCVKKKAIHSIFNILNQKLRREHLIFLNQFREVQKKSIRIQLVVQTLSMTVYHKLKEIFNIIQIHTVQNVQKSSSESKLIFIKPNSLIEISNKIPHAQIKIIQQKPISSRIELDNNYDKPQYCLLNQRPIDLINSQCSQNYDNTLLFIEIPRIPSRDLSKSAIMNSQAVNQKTLKKSTHNIGNMYSIKGSRFQTEQNQTQQSAKKDEKRFIRIDSNISFAKPLRSLTNSCQKWKNDKKILCQIIDNLKNSPCNHIQRRFSNHEGINLKQQYFENQMNIMSVQKLNHDQYVSHKKQITSEKFQKIAQEKKLQHKNQTKKQLISLKRRKKSLKNSNIKISQVSSPEMPSDPQNNRNIQLNTFYCQTQNDSQQTELIKALKIDA